MSFQQISKKVLALSHALITDDRGVETTETVLILGILAVMAFLATKGFSTSLAGLWNNVVAAL